MADQFVIERASRKRVKLRLALQSPAGGGKTATSLLLARGMVGALQARGALPTHLEDCFIGMLDTEEDSASLYSHLAVFDRVVLRAPYTVDRYLDALGALERVGYPVIIVDQISHEWSGAGGILQQVGAGKSSNDWANWNGPSQDHERFMEALLTSPAHLLCTMRAKTAYVLEERVNSQGRKVQVPVRVGMQARQREGTEYDFTTVLDLTVGTNAVRCVKDRTELFEVGETIPRMDETWGVRLIDWVYSATAAAPAPVGPTPAMRAEAMCAAGCRFVEQASTLPDLERVFVEQQRLLRGMSVDAGAEIVRPLLVRLIAAKDARKDAFGPTDRPVLAGESISPDDVTNLEVLLQDARVPGDSFKTQFGIQRLSHLPLARWHEAQGWVIGRATLELSTGLVPYAHIAPRVEPAGPPTAPERLERLVGEITASRDAASPNKNFFEGLQDDRPWEDDGVLGDRR